MRYTTILTAAAITIMAAAAGAQESGAPSPAVSKEASDAVHAMGACLGGLDSFSFEATTMVDEVTDSGQKVQFSNELSVAIKRPDKFKGAVRGDKFSREALFDGSTFTRVDRDHGVYGQIDVPGGIDAMLDHMAERYGVVWPLADLLFSKPDAVLMAGVKSGTYVGLHAVGEHPCHHLAFTQDDLDWQIWIDAGEKPLPRKMVITYKKLDGHPQFIALLRRWDTAVDTSDADFAFAPGSDLKRIQFLPFAEK